jgi:hypothetical protein
MLILLTWARSIIIPLPLNRKRPFGRKLVSERVPGEAASSVGAHQLQLKTCYSRRPL